MSMHQDFKPLLCVLEIKLLLGALIPVSVPLKSTQKQVDVSKRGNAIDKGGEFLDSKLIAKYDVSGPRYTSYPTAPHFSAAFTEQAYRQEADQSLKNSIAPLSLYLKGFGVSFF